MNYQRLVFPDFRRWNKETVGELTILAACFFYGIAFPMQRYVMLNNLGPITFSALRLFVSAILVCLMRPLLNMIPSERMVALQNHEEDLTARNEHGDIVPPVPLQYYGALHSPRFGHPRSRSIDSTISYGREIKLRSHSLDEGAPLERTRSKQKLAAFNEVAGFQDDMPTLECDGQNAAWELWVMGALLGVNDGIAAILQQISMVFISGGQAAFITSMYVIAVPMIEWLFPCLHGRMTPLAWIASIAR